VKSAKNLNRFTPRLRAGQVAKSLSLFGSAPGAIHKSLAKFESRVLPFLGKTFFKAIGVRS
jgi:hypothetical protein